MNRRRFLHLTSLGAVTAAWAGAVWRGEPGAGAAAGLAGEIEKARAAGKPLLVLVVPEDEGERWARGDLFGTFLNRAGAAGMADLALAHVVCATMAEVRGALPDALPAGEPTMVLIETGGGAAAARVLEPVLPKTLSYADVREGTFEEREQRIEDSLRARSEALGEFLSGVLTGDREQLATRAAQCAAALDDEDLLGLKRADDVGALDLELVDRGAAWLAEEALDSKEPRRSAIEAALAAAAVRRLRDVPPAGARWATHAGCGFEVEGQEADADRLMVQCGMGHVPEISRRFLYFFSAR